MLGRASVTNEKHEHVHVTGFDVGKMFFFSLRVLRWMMWEGTEEGEDRLQLGQPHVHSGKKG